MASQEFSKKAETITGFHEKPRPFFSFRSHQKKTKKASSPDNNAPASEVDTQLSTDVAPVTLTELFRYVRSRRIMCYTA